MYTRSIFCVGAQLSLYRNFPRVQIYSSPCIFPIFCSLLLLEACYSFLESRYRGVPVVAADRRVIYSEASGHVYVTFSEIHHDEESRSDKATNRTSPGNSECSVQNNNKRHELFRWIQNNCRHTIRAADIRSIRQTRNFTFIESKHSVSVRATSASIFDDRRL